MMNIKHTEAFDLAYRFVTETNRNIFLTGKAGTGKTTFLKYLRQTSFKKMVVAAPTGVAAINAGGVTLHSLFQLPFAPFIPSKNANADAVNSHSLLSQVRYNKEKLNLLRNLELLVIDESSMVASHTVDAIDTILRSIRRRHQQPFGGAQVLFIGDLHQLPPVVKNQEWEFLKNYYPSVFFFDSIVLRENVPVMIELKEIFRQQDNAFIEVLNEIRNNNLTNENFSLLNSRLKRPASSGTADDEGYITLTTHNYQADEINKRKLQKLSAHSQTYHASIQGDFPENLYPAEPELELKEGAQVMFLKNDVEEKKYFNGKIGVITELDEDMIKVKCKGEQQKIEVKKHEWKNVNYSLNPDTHEITEEELGSFLQYPLRLAWAITIHKSQGLTFDKLIIDAENAFANGQVYVALSRCTSLEGLILTSHVNRKFLGAHQNLKDWQEKNHDEKNLQQKFHESRQKHIQQELQNIFTWKNWFYELRELNDILNEQKENLPSECFSWIAELTEKQKALDEAAVKFKEHMVGLCNQNPVVEENQPLQKRIKDAANYFSAEIMKWKEKFFNHPLSTDTKKTARKIDASLNEINIIVHEILHKINHCKNGFLLNDYLKNGKKVVPIYRDEKIQSSYAQKQIRNISSKELEHSGLYDSIAEMRGRIGSATNLPLYTIFSNNAIKNVCMSLPGSKDALLKVKGFGKAKVKKYGDEVLGLVREYCLENNLEPQQIFKESRQVGTGEKKSTTVESR
ncbi:MAG: AAA family ATPase [Thermodesulfovibrionales bacterium]|nr:AAA family ATPase [Thermodesulfovibrionales bacterium]